MDVQLSVNVCQNESTFPLKAVREYRRRCHEQTGFTEHVSFPEGFPIIWRSIITTRRGDEW